MSIRRLVIGVILLLVFAAQLCPAQATPSKADLEKRVDSILSQMTQEEKLTIIGGINDFYTRPIPRLGIPALRMSDGPMGVHDYGLTTAYPAGVALAASWDVDLARRVGDAMGQDARARGVHFILGPGMNIYRAPMNGRNFEYFGEDPFLASRIAVSVIKGIQGHTSSRRRSTLPGTTPNSRAPLSVRISMSEPCAKSTCRHLKLRSRKVRWARSWMPTTW
jgi:beta-glucosidase